MIQKSICYKQIRNIRLAKYDIQSLKRAIKSECNVKAIIMTNLQFEKILILSGNNLDLDKETVTVIKHSDKDAKKSRDEDENVI